MCYGADLAIRQAGGPSVDPEPAAPKANAEDWIA
jgi:hypothetical protein